MNRPCLFAPIAALALLLGGSGATAGERFAIEGNASGAERVEVVDVNGDGRADVVAVGRGVCSWYENPSWARHLITGVAPIPGLCTSATADLDGDGWAEVVLGSAADPAKGTPAVIRLAARKPDGGGWEVAEAGTVPDLGQVLWFHRPEIWEHSVRFVRVGSTGPASSRKDKEYGSSLMVTPGREVGPLREYRVDRYVPPPPETSVNGIPIVGFGQARLLSPSHPPLLGRWTMSGPMNSLGPPITYGEAEIVTGRPHGSIGPRVLAATGQGVMLHYVAAIAGAVIYNHQILVPPGQGSEIESVREGWSGETRRWLALVERSEGKRRLVVVEGGPGGSTPGEESRIWPTRIPLDSSPGSPRATWAGDLDGDGSDELVAGDVGPAGNRLIRFDRGGSGVESKWQPSVLDPDIDARDLRGGDLDGDGRPDLFAVDAAGRITGYRSGPPAGGR